MAAFGALNGNGTLHLPREGVWFLDRAAARLLGG